MFPADHGGGQLFAKGSQPKEMTLQLKGGTSSAPQAACLPLVVLRVRRQRIADCDFLQSRRFPSLFASVVFLRLHMRFQGGQLCRHELRTATSEQTTRTGFKIVSLRLVDPGIDRYGLQVVLASFSLVASFLLRLLVSLHTPLSLYL